MTAVLNSIAPIMPSKDFDRTVRFYGQLGFTVGGRYEAEGYLILKSGQVEIHFFRHPDAVAEESDHGAYLRLDDPAAWSAEIAPLGLPSTGIPRFAPAEPKPWGMLELAVIDPDGNLLRAGAPLETANG